MKIGIDARLINQTGVGRYIQELINNLQLIDKVNTYLIFLPSDMAQKFEIRNSIPQSGSSDLRSRQFEIREIDIRWHSLKEQIVMPWILWREHLDLVHFPYFSVPIFYPGKFIVTIHDLILDHFDTGKAWNNRYCMVKWQRK